MKKAIYPGTFDPITKGHLDIIQRASDIFGGLTIAVAQSHAKKPMFTLEQRMEMIKEATDHLKNITIIGFDNLLVDLAKAQEAQVIVRGLRAVSDFEYELQMSYANASLDPTIETLYLMPTLEYAFVSSSVVRTILSHNEDKIAHLVPTKVHHYIQKINQGKR